MLSDNIIANWLYKSDEAMSSAEQNLNLSLSTSQNRIYYAIFYAVNALARKHDFTTSKHAQLLGWFNKNFVRTGRIDTKVAKVYAESYEYRQKSDYTFAFTPKKEILEINIIEVKQFIDCIKVFLRYFTPPTPPAPHPALSQ